jgi:hypothetical protein
MRVLQPPPSPTTLRLPSFFTLLLLDRTEPSKKEETSASTHTYTYNTSKHKVRGATADKNGNRDQNQTRI